MRMVKAQAAKALLRPGNRGAGAWAGDVTRSRRHGLGARARRTASLRPEGGETDPEGAVQRPRRVPHRFASAAASSRRAGRAAFAGWLAGLLVLAGAPLAQDAVTAVVGQPVLALAQRPELTTALRFNSGGHRGALAARLRDPGPPVGLAENRYLHGFGCMEEGGCRAGGAFLAYDMQEDRVFLLLTEQGRVRLSVPPDARAWPGALRAPVEDFVPAIAEAMGAR